MMRRVHSSSSKFISGSKQATTIMALVAIVLLFSFIPLFSWSSNSGTKVIDTYGEAGGFILSYPRRHMKLMRDQIIERDKLISKLKNDIETSHNYFNKDNYDKIQEKTRKLIEDYIELQTRSQTLEQIAEESQNILKKRDMSSVSEVAKLNSTYAKIFTEMKRKLNSLQGELDQQVEISENLEKELREQKLNGDKKDKQTIAALNAEIVKLKDELTRYKKLTVTVNKSQPEQKVVKAFTTSSATVSNRIQTKKPETTLKATSNQNVRQTQVLSNAKTNHVMNSIVDDIDNEEIPVINSNDQSKNNLNQKPTQTIRKNIRNDEEEEEEEEEEIAIPRPISSH